MKVKRGESTWKKTLIDEQNNTNIRVLRDMTVQVSWKERCTSIRLPLVVGFLFPQVHYCDDLHNKWQLF